LPIRKRESLLELKLKYCMPPVSKAPTYLWKITLSIFIPQTIFLNQKEYFMTFSVTKREMKIYHKFILPKGKSQNIRKSSLIKRCILRILSKSFYLQKLTKEQFKVYRKLAKYLFYGDGEKTPRNVILLNLS